MSRLAFVSPLLEAGWPPALVTLALFATAILAGLAVHQVTFWLLDRISRKTHTRLDQSVVEQSRAPARVLVPLAAMQFTLPIAPLDDDVLAVVRHAMSLVLIGGVAWLLVRLVRVLADALLARHSIDHSDNLDERKIYTQLRLLRRVLVVTVVIVAGSAALMTFDRVRQLGTSILASAGVAGIVIGIAAQKTLANLIAGIQLAISQPIRIDDVVVVEGEWGRIEEITFTYVVVRIWDKRRLVVPLTYFINKPFENWTRVTADLLGTVFVHVDYTVPFEAVREELQRILEATDLWDGESWNLQVTEAGERTVQLRALMSAPSSSQAWDLRCHVRERLVAWLQENYPDALPRLRADLEGNSSREPDEAAG